MRLPFIDIAKGISILLVIMVHVGVPEPFVGAYAAKVPIFFLISGLFFKKIVNRGGYITAKFKSLLVPFFLYYIGSYILFYSIYSFKPNIIWGENTFSITDVFTQRNLFNGPLWFLLSLFEVEAIFYLIYTYIKSELTRALTVFCLTSIGFILAYRNCFIPLWLDTSCVALMYFYFGYLLSLTKWENKPLNIPILIVLGLVTYMLFRLMPVTIGMSINYYSNILLAITSGSLIIIFILTISKLLEKLKFIAWIGSNSLVILCTHHLIYRPIKYIQIQNNIENPYLLLIATLILEVIIVLFVNKYIPLLAGKYKKTPYPNRKQETLLQ